MPKRKLKDLNLMDDFLFETIAAHPVWGEPFSRILLETIFRKKFGKLQAVPQKVYYGKDTNLHGTRLDVYFEELPEKDGTGETSIYDLEPNLKSGKLRTLSRRTRFYHALIDADCLKSGKDYITLKNVMVIFMMPNDPFGAGRMMYTVRAMCMEDPSLPYDDGSGTVFLYTKGTKGNPPKELQELLRYMENSIEENAVNEDLKLLHQIVETAKQNKEVELGYMKSWEREQELRKEASEAGHAEGFAKGHAEGRIEGRMEGRMEGRVEGRAEGRAEERLNTEREKRRADLAEQRAKQAEEENQRLYEELQKYKKN